MSTELDSFDDNAQWKPATKEAFRKFFHKQKKVKGKIVSLKEEAFQAKLRKMNEAEE